MKARIIAAFLGIALLAGVAYFAWSGLRLIYAVFADLTPDVAVTTAIASILALTAAWTIARGGIGGTRGRVKEIALREEKTTTYQLFVDFWESLLRRGRTQAGELPADLAGKLRMLERMLALYGGASVIRAHTALRSLEAARGPGHPDLRAKLGEAIVAIRRDLGADTPLDAAFEIERLLLPSADEPRVEAMDARDARFRTVLATNG